MKSIRAFSIACALSLCCQAPAAAEAMAGKQEKKPLKVYLLAGQSNMTGRMATNTLEHIKMFPDTAKEFAALFDKDGRPVKLDGVYVSQWKGLNTSSHP